MGLAPWSWTRDLCLRGFLQRSGGVARLVGNGAELAAGGVSAAGVVAGDPDEHRAAGRDGAVPAGCAGEGLPLEGGVERLGEGVVGAGADRAHRAGHTEPAAQLGVGPRRVLGAVVPWKIAPVRLPRSRTAAASASVTRSVRMWSAIDQPTSRREKQSITVAR